MPAITADKRRAAIAAIIKDFEADGLVITDKDVTDVMVQRFVAQQEKLASNKAEATPPMKGTKGASAKAAPKRATKVDAEEDGQVKRPREQSPLDAEDPVKAPTTEADVAVSVQENLKRQVLAVVRPLGRKGPIGLTLDGKVRLVSRHS